MYENSKAICMITFCPNEINLQFLSSFNDYDIFVIIDDNQFDTTELKIKYSNIQFIQIQNEKCYSSGFKNSNMVVLKKEVSGWDKALYYFSCMETEYYKNVWFMEDDVYFYNENTLIEIDEKYKDTDLLCNSSFETANLNEWLWNRIEVCFSPPYYCGMMCICRFSRKMLESIKDYAFKNGTVFFLEAFFPTIAVKYNLTFYKNPHEFITVTYRDNFDINSLNKINLYHPMKNIEKYIEFRNLQIEN